MRLATTHGAALMLSLEAALPDVEWSPTARMGDRVTHHYLATDRNVVWTTATESVPELRTALTNALTGRRRFGRKNLPPVPIDDVVPRYREEVTGEGSSPAVRAFTKLQSVASDRVLT